MELEDALREFDPVGKAFESLKVSYQLGGSVASSHYGFPRGTRDVDVEADLKEEHIEPLVEMLNASFMITPEMVREAIRYRRSFNLIPWDSFGKIDVFIPKDREYDQQAMSRRQFGIQLDTNESAPYWVNSAEDVVLRKLEWYRMGGQTSTQQWSDVRAVLKTQFFDIDLTYLRNWATPLGVADLLEKALDESGFNE